MEYYLSLRSLLLVKRAFPSSADQFFQDLTDIVLDQIFVLEPV
jgi:hypothetical protein